MKKKILFSILMMQVLIGCASTVDYTEPASHKTDNQTVINESFDVVWDRLVKNLVSDFFVINNIEKASRLINVSWSTDRPSSYVDCGHTDIKGASKVYSYPTANSANYTVTDGLYIYNAIRTTRLNGIANVHLAPKGNGVIVSVNVKYVLTINEKSYRGVNKVSDTEYIFDFTTKSRSSQKSNDAHGVICASNGSVERTILRKARL